MFDVLFHGVVINTFYIIQQINDYVVIKKMLLLRLILDWPTVRLAFSTIFEKRE